MSRQDSIDFHLNYCVHYNPQPGMAGVQCKAGMDIKTIQCVPTEDGKIKWGPCIGGHTLKDPKSHCPRWERRSQESAEKYADSIQKAFNRMAAVMPAVSKWRTRPRPKSDRSEVIECPACAGRLHLTQSSYNGHVHAKCETDDCVSFME